MFLLILFRTSDCCMWFVIFCLISHNLTAKRDVVEKVCAVYEFASGMVDELAWMQNSEV